ncbi:hypothetical protein [Paraburkholderia sp. Cpub6]|uniref:hypothetical protein n=1 Tax=Paraburkholderia sp. Cpub6 TaxID=2723094 RepID=UPI00181B50E9|nr:hypothetical protein [Paraburkholderia sp. Cpub6]MBB5460249.1 hypothetical protein [Paraburkholderia sp. Cpub6]
MQAQKSKRFYADECDLGAMFRQRARDLGFTRGPLLDRVSMFEHFRDRYGDELLKSLGFIESGRKPTFVHELSAARKQTGLLRVAYLIDFFYEHFNEFEASVTAFASSGAEPKLCGRPPRGRTFSGQKLALATGRVKDYLRENPETTRTELLAKCRHAACYLMLHDRETYEAVMPPTRRRIGYGASRAQRMAQLDDALLKHIQMRRELLRSGPMHEWRRLSVWTLLMGHPSARSFYSLKQDLPKSSAAIKSILIDPV